ncbi:MAG: protein of unknown function DUF1326, partial [uncultured Solirubrobacteraceae bacterium]
GLEAHGAVLRELLLRHAVSLQRFARFRCRPRSMQRAPRLCDRLGRGRWRRRRGTHRRGGDRHAEGDGGRQLASRRADRRSGGRPAGREAAGGLRGSARWPDGGTRSTGRRAARGRAPGYAGQPGGRAPRSARRRRRRPRGRGPRAVRRRGRNAGAARRRLPPGREHADDCADPARPLERVRDTRGPRTPDVGPGRAVRLVGM